MLKNKAIAQKLGSAMFAGLMVLTAGAAMAAAPASATTCTAWKGTTVINNAPDEYRASASCTEISADRKVEAQLNRNNQTDRFSDYFTTENKTYRTGWVECFWGCSAEYNVADV
ncbi:hypothetical protein [Promicromonospora sp. NPDC023805]|uniref:hypothetical protein n=1 Tax=Promicromonospora sp. NPDC023805 TaxID=3154696 RepID=UPI0033EE995B